MINVSLQVRRAVVEDHLQIASLIHNEVASHRHLDWRVPLEWIGSPNYWVLEDGGRITANLLNHLNTGLLSGMWRAAKSCAPTSRQ